MALCTFTTLAIVDYITGSQRFNVNTVVTSLTLMQILQEPLNQVGQNYGSIIAALVSIKRIQEFLAKEEQPKQSLLGLAPEFHTLSRSSSTDSNQKPRTSSTSIDATLDSGVAASFRSATIGWSMSKPVLVNVALDIPRNKLTMICGTLASGKSTLLQSLLGETNIISGTVQLPIKREPIAYVSQECWLQEGGTIHDNIVFDTTFDAERYRTVINATALDIDLTELPKKDQTLAKALSGGQRQRLALARALYSDVESYVLDDFTSALDAETAAHVWKALMGPAGLLRNKTVIMVTNALQLLRDASLVIRLEDGRVVEAGTYSQFSEKGKSTVARSSLEIERASLEDVAAAAMSPDGKKTEATSEDKEDDRHEEVETGTIKWSVYGQWLKAISYKFVAFSQISNVLYISAIIGWNTYLQFWSRAASSDPSYHEETFKWMGGFLALIFAASILLPVQICTLFYGTLVKSGTKLHLAELKGVFGAPLSFFEENASGRIINRFSQDLFVLDWEISLAAGNFTSTGLNLFAQVSQSNGQQGLLSTDFSTSSPQLLTLIIPVPYLTAVIFIVFILYFFIQRLYAPVSRQLRRLEMATKSPIYTLFSETSSTSGLATIRALQRQEHFIDTNIGRLNRSQQPYFYLQAVRRWLQTWLNIISLIINVALVAIVVLLRNTASVGLLGVGLVQATTITQNLNYSLVAYTELEIASVALERVLAFAKIPKEQNDFVDGQLRRKVEPKEVKGEIEFRNANVIYKGGLKPALKDISFTIKAGERLGVCGRSGSGKSTMLLAIFAMLELTQGDIYLDGQAISKMDAHTLRRSLTIVPQDALILSATVRENLDPESEHDDSELWNALEVCKLLDIIKAFPDQLSTLLAKDVNLSAGQRQLFSLARALLRKRKVLVLDEATSSMDYQTDADVQGVLRSQFNDCTIITVAHRIATVRDYDRILVLSAGQMVELDTPDALMQRPASIFRSLALEQGVE
jgi:ATP-binding cassette subfamily C (CFTR/MRP) protein 1